MLPVILPIKVVIHENITRTIVDGMRTFDTHKIRNLTLTYRTFDTRTKYRILVYYLDTPPIFQYQIKIYNKLETYVPKTCRSEYARSPDHQIIETVMSEYYFRFFCILDF